MKRKRRIYSLHKEEKFDRNNCANKMIRSARVITLFVNQIFIVGENFCCSTVDLPLQ